MRDDPAWPNQLRGAMTKRMLLCSTQHAATPVAPCTALPRATRHRRTPHSDTTPRCPGPRSFRLISYRQDMAFAFMRQAFTTPVLAAWGPTIGVARPNAPLQPRLALVGSDPSRMQLQWSTANSSRPTVRWGAMPGAAACTVVL